MRNISFSMTTKQYQCGTKTVTRRLGWTFLKPGEILMGVEKCRGLRKGEHVKKIHPCRVVSVEVEPLIDIVKRPVRGYDFPEVMMEGFPNMLPGEFVQMFCEHNHCAPETIVTRIEFGHIWNMPVQGRLIA